MSRKLQDSSNLSAKLALRRYYLQKYHADGPVRVFDACQGDGVIWSALAEEFKVDVFGCDIKRKKGRLKGNSVAVIGAEGFKADIIDIDTYGSPFQHLFALMRTLTDATTVFATFGINSAYVTRIPDEMAMASG